MRITSVEAVNVRSADQPPDNSHEATVVMIETDDGRVGLGEAHSRPAAVKAYLDETHSWDWSLSVRDFLLDEDFDDPRSAWDALYAKSWWVGRCGIGHAALAAVDIALWDLAGQAAGLPVWQLLNDGEAKTTRPYFTVWHGPARTEDAIQTTCAAIDEARAIGICGAKIEPLHGVVDDDASVIAFVRAVREHVGDDFTLMCDVGYRWRDADTAIECVKRLDEFDLYFLEAPLLPEDLNGYRRLSEAVTTPIAGAEIVSSAWECTLLMEFGRAGVLQPALSRVGITATDRLATEARAYNCLVIPLGWCPTTIGTVAAIHTALAHENMPMIEYAPPWLYGPREMTLRRNLIQPEPIVADGEIAPPEAPGFGLQVDPEALARYRVTT